MSSTRSWLFLTVSLLLVYASSWTIPYLITDDYGTMLEKINDNLLGSQNGVIAGGRPIYAASLIAAFSFITDFTQLRFIRLIGVVGIATAVWTIYIYLKAKNWSETASLSVAFVIGCIPSFQIMGSWTITFIFPWAVALSGLSAYILHYGTTRLRFVFSIILLLISFHIYQPAAMFFMAFGAIQCFGNHQKLLHMLKSLGYHIGVFFVCASISLISQKLLLHILWGSDSYLATRSGFTHDLFGKMMWFIKEPLVNSLNIFNLKPSIWLATVVFVVVLVGLWFYFEGGIKEKVIRIAVALCFLPAAYAPNLVVTESWSSYRTIGPITAIVILYLLFSFKKILKNFNSKVVICAAVLAGLYASYNMTITIAIPQFMEMATIRTQLLEADLPNTKTIYLVKGDWDHSMSPIIAYDEFGIPSTSKPWSQQTAVFLALQKIDPKYTSLPVVAVDDRSKVPAEGGVLILDVKRLEVLKSFFY